MTTKTATQAKTTKTTPAVTTCRCGCKLQTIRTDAMYLPGHDARHAGKIGRAIIDDPAGMETFLAELPTDRLRTKAQAMVAKEAERRAERDRKAAAREAAKAAA